jgi:oxygen-independent coproporphyrinogen-3 oxidase
LCRATEQPRSAYIHVPFCAHRCGYCDFTLVARRDDLIDAYLRAMEIELSRLEEPPVLDTLFLGGGTPTHLSPEQLSRLLELLRRSFHLADGCEFAAEANPSGLSADKIAVLADGGVNRVSLGIQSFDPQILKLLERDHRPERFVRSHLCCAGAIEGFVAELARRGNWARARPRLHVWANV